MVSSEVREIEVSKLNFEVVTKPLQAICESQIIQAGKYLGIYDKNSLLGIKPNKELLHLVLNHHQSYQLGQALYDRLFGTGVSKVCFLSKDKSWMASLIGEEKTKRGGFMNYQTSLFSDQSREFELNKGLLLEKLADHGFRPAIGVVNGFDYNDSLAFYLLVEPIEPYSGKLPVLTLASFKFDEKQQHEIALQQADSREATALQLLEQEAQSIFLKELKAFLELYSKLSTWPSDPESLIALSLDFYNKNRNVASIAADKQLAGELRRFIQAAEAHYHNSQNMAAIINFIMRYNQFDFNVPHYLRTKVEQLFVRKRSYQKMVRILGQYGPTSSGFDKYLAEQRWSYEQTHSAFRGIILI